jgi:hypothetical protein
MASGESYIKSQQQAFSHGNRILMSSSRSFTFMRFSGGINWQQGMLPDISSRYRQRDMDVECTDLMELPPAGKWTGVNHKKQRDAIRIIKWCESEISDFDNFSSVIFSIVPGSLCRKNTFMPDKNYNYIPGLKLGIPKVYLKPVCIS